MKRGVKMLADDTRTGERGQLGDGAALRVLPRQLDDHSAFPRYRVLQDLSGLDRPEVGRRGQIRMRHAQMLPSAAPDHPHRPVIRVGEVGLRMLSGSPGRRFMAACIVASLTLVGCGGGGSSGTTTR